MQPADFTENASGKVVRSPQGYWAFVPNPLPPAIEPDWELINTLSDADRALSGLNGVACNLPNRHLLIGPFVRREAVLSSRIEGTQASLSDLFFFEAAQPAPRNGMPIAPDVREVANYVRAMEHGLARLKTLPVSLRLFRELHERLMEGVRGQHSAPGEFRHSQNWIGPPGGRLEDAIFVPPPLPEMQQALDHFERFLHSPCGFPPLVRLALVHYQFEAIHPFLDGNGRIGRLLVSLLLCHDKVLEKPLLYLSAYFEKYRTEYYARLLSVSQWGDWPGWIVFFLRGVAEQSADAIWRTGNLLNLWRSYRRMFESARSSALLLRLIDNLFNHPVITLPRASSVLGITHRSASLNVQKLADAGILQEITGRERHKVFVARKIMEIIEEQMPD